MAKHFKKATLDEVFRNVTDLYQDKTAIIFEDKKLSYSFLKKTAYNIAIKLGKLGVKKDDKVAILLPNCYEYLCLYCGCFLLGAWVVPINFRIKQQELRNILIDSDAETIFFEEIIGVHNYAKMFDEIKEETKLKHLIINGKNTYSNMLSFQEFFDIPDTIDDEIQTYEQPRIEEDDVALLAYTSGTTSTPKGAMLTHRGLVYTAYHTGCVWGVGKYPKDFVALSVAPLYAAQGYTAVLIDLVNGVAMNWLSTFNPKSIVQAISKGDVYIFHTQPTMWSLLLSLPAAELESLDKLEMTVASGSLCSYNLAKRIEETTRSTLLINYGLIEATGAVTVTRPDDPVDVRLNTVGRPIPGVEIKIVDQDRKDVAKGEVGEVAIRGYLMKGYYKNEAKTREVIDDDGWLYSGDLGYYYDDENIQLVGRAKEMIIRGGFNVYPIDVEEQLLEFEKVQDAAVVGRDDEILGEAIVAFIIPKFGFTTTRGEVLKHCTQRLSSHKIPDEIVFLKRLPTLLSGKVRKNVLREWANSTVPEDELLR